MRRTNEAMGTSRHNAGDQPLYPLLEYDRPGRLRELPAEEGHPVAHPALDTEGGGPGLDRQWFGRLRHGAELLPILVHPVRHHSVTAEGDEGFSGHRSVIWTRVCHLWPGTAQTLQCVVNHRLHSKPPALVVQCANTVLP